jgi:hypothetical protein
MCSDTLLKLLAIVKLQTAPLDSAWPPGACCSSLHDVSSASCVVLATGALCVSDSTSEAVAPTGADG